MRFTVALFLSTIFFVAIFPLSLAYGQDVPQNTDTTAKNTDTAANTTGGFSLTWGRVLQAGLFILNPSIGALKWAIGNEIADSIPPVKEAKQEVMTSAINAIVPVAVPIMGPVIGLVPGANSAMTSAMTGLQLLDKPVFSNTGPQQVPPPETLSALSIDSNGIEARFSALPGKDNLFAEPNAPQFEPTVSGLTQIFPTDDQTQDYSNVVIQPQSPGFQEGFGVVSPQTLKAQTLQPMITSKADNSSWNRWSFPDNDSGYSGTIAPSVSMQVQQDVTATESTLPSWIDFRNTDSSSEFKATPADDYGPYDWASQFYNPPRNLGQTLQSDEWLSFSTDGGNYDWSF